MYVLLHEKLLLSPFPANHNSIGFALYRALQRRSRKVFPNEQADSFEKHVKNAFRINAKARSRASICAALNTGYAVCQNLHTSLHNPQLISIRHWRI